MKNSNKIKITTNITKTSLEVLPSKVPSLGVFSFSRWIIIFNVKMYFLYICFSKKSFLLKILLLSLVVSISERADSKQ